MKCVNCSFKDKSFTYCPKCGHSQKVNDHCPSCNAVIPSNHKNCIICGKDINSSSNLRKTVSSVYQKESFIAYNETSLGKIFNAISNFLYLAVYVLLAITVFTQTFTITNLEGNRLTIIDFLNYFEYRQGVIGYESSVDFLIIIAVIFGSLGLLTAGFGILYGIGGFFNNKSEAPSIIYGITFPLVVTPILLLKSMGYESSYALFTNISNIYIFLMFLASGVLILRFIFNFILIKKYQGAYKLFLISKILCTTSFLLLILGITFFTINAFNIISPSNNQSAGIISFLMNVLSIYSNDYTISYGITLVLSILMIILAFITMTFLGYNAIYLTPTEKKFQRLKVYFQTLKEYVNKKAFLITYIVVLIVMVTPAILLIIIYFVNMNLVNNLNYILNQNNYDIRTTLSLSKHLTLFLSFAYIITLTGTIISEYKLLKLHFKEN